MNTEQGATTDNRQDASLKHEAESTGYMYGCETEEREEKEMEPAARPRHYQLLLATRRSAEPEGRWPAPAVECATGHAVAGAVLVRGGHNTIATRLLPSNFPSTLYTLSHDTRNADSPLGLAAPNEASAHRCSKETRGTLSMCAHGGV